MAEDEIVGWHHWLDGQECEQTLADGEGQGSLACCSSWGSQSRTRPSSWSTKTSWLENLGRGNYSEVFEAVNITNSDRVILKILKPGEKKNEKMRSWPFWRTFLVEQLSFSWLTPWRTLCWRPALVFEYINNTDFKICPISWQIFISGFNVLKKIPLFYNYLKLWITCHIKGICTGIWNLTMSWKSTTRNTVTDILGSGGDLYHPAQDYNVQVTSRYFMGPEHFVD